MALRRFTVLALSMIMIAGLIGCSDDDDPVDPGVPDGPSIETVVVSPESATFTSIGEDLQFDVVAFDASGSVVDTVFAWQSSDVDVVAIGADGIAVATGLGTAEVYAMASGVADTAAVTVTLASGPVHEWAVGGSGSWQDANNWSSGEVPGGGTADPVMNVRLILVDAPSAVMRGIIRPDLDGAPARLDIQGLVSLESTFRVELDAVTSGAFNTESVTFLTGGQELGGTLAINALDAPTPGVDYRVIYTTLGTGAFDAISGAEPFTEIVEDAQGVLLRR